MSLKGSSPPGSLDSYWERAIAGDLRHVQQAQQVLRRLVKGRLTFTPHVAAKDRSYYTFEGIGTMQPLLGGVVRNLASPMPVSWNQILPFLQQMAQLREMPGSAA